jgi:heat shock protein HtpX
MDSLFSTHPATENRIAALQAMADEMGRSGAPEPRPQAPKAPPGPVQADEGDASGPWGKAGGSDMPAEEPVEPEPERPKPNPWGRNPTGPKGPWS